MSVVALQRLALSCVYGVCLGNVLRKRSLAVVGREYSLGPRRLNFDGLGFLLWCVHFELTQQALAPGEEPHGCLSLTLVLFPHGRRHLQLVQLQAPL